MLQIYNVYAICAFAAMGGGLFGFDISSMSGVLGTNGYKNYFGHPVSSTQGGITASMPAGSLLGALASSFIADKFSRRTAIQIAGLIFMVGAALQCSAHGIAQLCVGRVIAGMGVGIASAMVPVYQSEIAPKEIRGRVVSLQQWAITWGILIQYFIQYGASFVDGGPDSPTQGPAAFRIPWGIQMIPAALLVVGMSFFPRSPRWLASKDRWEEALEVLAKLRKSHIHDSRVLAEFKEIQDQLEFERTETVSSYRALVEPRMFKRVILGMSIQMWSQLCGMNIMMYYIVYIMEGANIASPLLTASIQYIINVALTLPAILYLDKWGRRPSMLLGSFGMMTWLFISGALQGAYGVKNDAHDAGNKLKDITWTIKPEHSSVSKAVVACSYLFVATFATTWGPASWTYPSEIFPSKIRAKAVSLSTASNWAWNCVLAYAVPPLLWSINWKMYMIFATFNGLAFIHVFLAAPETKGRTLEEMDEVFDSGIKPWKKAPPSNRLDQLAQDIADNNVKINIGGRQHVVRNVNEEPKPAEV